MRVPPWSVGPLCPMSVTHVRCMCLSPCSPLRVAACLMPWAHVSVCMGTLFHVYKRGCMYLFVFLLPCPLSVSRLTWPPYSPQH